MSCTTAEMTGQFLSHSWSFLLSMSVHRLKLFFDSLVWRLQTQNSISPHPWIWYAVWLCHHHSEWQLFTAVTREDALQIEVFVPHDLSPELYIHTHTQNTILCIRFQLYCKDANNTSCAPKVRDKQQCIEMH